MPDVKTHHPEYSASRVAEWRLMRDAIAGESAIKEAGPRYLPLLDSHKEPTSGAARYASYQFNASFPEILSPTLFALIGIAHGKEIQIKMPSQLERLWEDCDGEGLPLEAFHKRITRQLLSTGRYGVLADAPEDGGDVRLAGYTAESLINWDTDFFVLDESGYERDGFEWNAVDRQRVLMLQDGVRYVQNVYVDGQFAGEIMPRIRGGLPLGIVPFTVASAVDVSGQIHSPPLIGVARAAVRIYNIDAEYRHILHNTVAGAVLLAVNGDLPAFVGPSAGHSMAGGEGVTPDLKYVVPPTDGAEKHKDAILDARIMAIQAGARLLEQDQQAQESGAARQLRFASETATLTSIVQASCGLLERALKDVALMEGLSEDDVIVTPPKDLLANTLTPTEFAALFGVYQDGGMSWETLYEKGREGGIYSPERDAKEEFDLIDGQGMTADASAALGNTARTDAAMPQNQG